MVKQDQNRSSNLDRVRKQSQITQQDFHITPENVIQITKRQNNKKNQPKQSSTPAHDFDRNEGEGRSQKS